jgi:Flp pilus assembly protein TadG
MRNTENGARPRKRGRRGSELLEFTFAFLPLLVIMFAIMDVSWSIFVKATLQYAVHVGVRQGIIITGPQAGGQPFTGLVRNIVEANSLGILSGATGLSYIHVSFYTIDQNTADATYGQLIACIPPASTGCNAPGNVMQVSVDSYPLRALVPHLYSWAISANVNPGLISAVAADEIEPSSDWPQTLGPTP